MVSGPVTDDSVDLDGQIVDAPSAAKALKEWLNSWGNVRQQHSPILAPAGKALSLDFEEGVPWVKALIVEPTAIKLTKAGVYQAFSIGIADGTLDTSPAAKMKAPNGILYPSLVNEISLVDYPANVHMGKFLIAKRAKNGTVKVVGKVMDGDDSLVRTLARSQHSGAIVHTAASEKEAQALIGTEFPASEYMADGPVIRTKRDMDPDVGGGVDRDKIPAEDFAGKNRSFPIVKPGDVSDAASSIGRAGDDNYSTDTLKKNIIAIAERKGPSFVAELPKTWRDEMKAKAKVKKAKRALKEARKAAKSPGSDKPFEGAAPEFGSDERAKDDKYDVKKKGKKKSAKAKHEAPDVDDDTDEVEDDDQTKAKSKKGKIPKVDQKVTEDLDDAHEAVSDAMDDQAKDNEAHLSGDDADDDDAKASKSSKKKLAKAARRMAKEAKKAREKAAAETAAAMKRAHDALCPLYKKSVVKGLGAMTEVIDPEFFRARLLEVGPENVETRAARKSAYDAASQIAVIPVKEAATLRRLAHKAFTDAYPDVHVASPDLSDPSSFQRGFLPSANSERATATSKPGNFVDAKPLEASQFTRGPLVTNEARPTLSTGVPATSLKSRTFYTNAAKDANENAMSVLHDHIVDNYPSVCPAGAGLADESGDRLGTPGEMYSHAPSTTAVDTKSDSGLVSVGADDAARATKRAIKEAVKPLLEKSKKQKKRIKSLKRAVDSGLAKPDITKSARRHAEFAPTHASVTPITESKRERVARVKMLGDLITDRHSSASHEDIEELRSLTTPEEFAAIVTATD